MALSLINRLSAGDVTLTLPASSALSFKEHFARFDVDATTPEIDVTTLAGEVNGEFDQGSSIVTIDFVIVVKKGVASTGFGLTGALLANPPGVAGTFKFDTGCTIAGTWNFNNCRASRPAGQTAIATGRARATGAVTIAWAIT